MIKILLNYDIKETRLTVGSELRKELIETYQYSNIKIIDGNIYELPTTMLYKEFEGIVEKDEDLITRKSQSEFLTACEKINAEWERYNVISYNVTIFGDHLKKK